MLRHIQRIIGASLIVGTLGIATWGGTAIAQAQPAFCDRHGTGQGQIYIHACAVGGGGGGSYITYVDANGKLQKISEHDLYSPNS